MMNNDKELDEILNDPLFDLNPTEKELFQLSEPIKQGQIKKQKAEEIAKRKPCENFGDYAGMFVQVHRDLKEGRRSLIRFKEDNLQEKVFFIADGIMGFVDQLDVDNRQIKDRVRKDGRSRVIYEDGTESNILFRTIGKNITKGGYIVTELNDGEELSGFKKKEDITEDDQAQGWIYILRSESTDERIASVKDLRKIGYTTTPVEERIKNAKNETTYLLADVWVEAEYKVYNINVQKLEYLLHQFFATARFHVKVGDAEPREWFVVPYWIVKQAISMCIDGTILDYVYNAEMQAIQKIEIENKGRVKTEKAKVDGFDILGMSIKQVFFDAILTGDKKIESRILKNSTLGKFTRLDKATGKRYIRQPHILRLYTSYTKDHDIMLVEVKKTVFHQPVNIEYHLGRILEYNLKAETAKRTGIIKKE